jgi:DNA-binding Xre family transcriptional regulator
MEKRVRKSVIPQEIVDLGKRIDDIISSKKLKTREVAHDADMDVENLRKYIKGRQEMKVSTLLKIAVALKIQPGDLLNALPTEPNNKQQK